MARRRIFAKRRPGRGRIAAALTVGAGAASVATWVALSPGPAGRFPDCADAAVRADLLALLEDEPALAQAPLRLAGVDERKRMFREGELFARDCAAVARVGGAEERIRFRITRDDEHGYVLTLDDA